MKIRKNDNVLIIAGKDKGKKGKVRFTYPKDDRVLVEGINFIKRHAKAVGQVRQAGTRVCNQGRIRGFQRKPKGTL